MPEHHEPLHAVVEIMGHRTRAGLISDATVGGAAMLRIEHPTATNHDGTRLVEYYAPGAVFAIRPCPADIAETHARYWTPPRPDITPQLSAPELSELVVVDDDEDYSVGDAYDEDDEP